MTEPFRPIRALAHHWRDALLRLRLDSSPVSAGRALLLMSGTVVLVTVPALGPSAEDWKAIFGVSLAVITVLLLSFALPWSRLPARCTLCFPITVMAAVGSLGAFSEGPVASSYLSLFVFCFAYVGLYEPLHSAPPLLVLGVPAYLFAIGVWNSSVAVRLVIGCAVWVGLAYVLGFLMLRQREATALLQRAALVDALTGVGTRRDLDDRLTRLTTGDTVVVCDLDHFKQVNDTLGHAAGDRVLRDFGAVLNGCLRGDDYAGRYGGEEFVLILSDTDEEEAAEVLGRLARRWRTTGSTTTFSAGYRAYRPGDSGVETLAAADLALYRAKHAGRNRAMRAEVSLTVPDTGALERC
ncbi:GGDEF domain-containing protein [Jatrophihabitans telluris]|uniref:GGDEF domain-containing protein n=1 Tax=Jatrophihabitans telluris TaxID=2038343 RepID=A0ABY4R0M2_9ACTN|nr:GGDEF domain-containing protein [Jatrophihabitans telluris]UQX89433.1 GGDEF domain-containing protein [Jatrophihabitans telluris]